jgi:hypothetical protein
MLADLPAMLSPLGRNRSFPASALPHGGVLIAWLTLTTSSSAATRSSDAYSNFALAFFEFRLDANASIARFLKFLACEIEACSPAL